MRGFIQCNISTNYLFINIHKYNINKHGGVILPLIAVNKRLGSVFRCENGLISFVNMKNCIQFYQTAEEMKAEVLKKHCSELISNHWVR
jgi:hypothetical protein